MIRADAPRLDNRSRGNAAQQLERYKSLARDATQSGDRITAEYYLQYADHYFRVLNENRPRYEDQRPQQRGDWQDQGGYQDGEAGREYGRDDEQGGEQQPAYAERNEGQRDNGQRDSGQRDDMGDESDYQQAQARGRDDRPVQRDDRQSQRDDRGRDYNNRDSGNRDNGQRDARAQNDRPREDRNGNQQRDRSREDRPREDRQARESYQRRDRWSQQGGAEPTDPPVPTGGPAIELQQAAEANVEAIATTAPRRGRPRRVEQPSDDPFAVRRAPQSEAAPVQRPVEASEPAAASAGEEAAPPRRRRARKADPDKDAELSLENV